MFQKKVVTVVTVVTALIYRGNFCHHLDAQVVTGGDSLARYGAASALFVAEGCRSQIDGRQSPLPSAPARR